MYLKSLELHGFKSFPDRTVLSFNPGTTIIVGPNGSGKSNITDAMRWVLGELSSKSLRGSKMEDVIFSGADGARPMGFAEVSVTFDNSGENRALPSDYDEITVTRRYYRAGDSAYFINKKPVRLKDIYELFMNTGIGREGYSIVGQGRIAEIISKKSEERRSIFEEAAGITKYRYRKNEAQKKLAETEGNMTRVGDIAAELAARVGPLEREAGKARRYLELYDEKKKLDVSLWKYDMDKTRESLESLEAQTRLSAHELEMTEDSLRAVNDTLERLYAATGENKEKSQRLYDELAGVRSEKSRLESDALLIENNTLHARELLESERRAETVTECSLETSKAKLSEAEARLGEAANSVAVCEGELAKANAEKNKNAELRAEKDKLVEELFTQRRAVEASVADLKIRLNVLQSSISEGSERREDTDREIEKYREELARLEEKIYEQAESVAMYERALEAEKQKFTDADARLEKLRAENDGIRLELSRESAECEALSSRISALERMVEHFDGYNNSIKYVMSQAASGRLSGIHGPLSHLIRVDEKYTVALETALGAALQNIVTSDEASAKAAIASLKRAGAGRATFYPMTTVKAQGRGAELTSAASCRGFIGFADELVECDEAYRDIVKSVVGRVAVFDNLDNASDMARARSWRVRTVTLDGQQINAGGSFTGGSARRDSGMLTRSSQIDAMKKQRALCEEKKSSLSAALEENERMHSRLSVERAGADEKRRLTESMAALERSSLGELEAKRDMTRELIEKLSGDVALIDENSRKSADDIRHLESLIDEGEKSIAELSKRREDEAALRGQLELDAEELSLGVSELRIRLAELEKDRESIIALADGLRESIAAAEQSLAESREKVRRLTDELESAARRRESVSAMDEQTARSLEELERHMKQIELEGEQLEQRLNEARQRERELSGKKELQFVAHTKSSNKLELVRGELDKMTSRLWDEYELTYSAAVELVGEDGYESVAEGTRQRCHARLTELKAQIRELGHVNVSAIDEYAETRERYDHIRVQLDDLEASKAELVGVIDGIESDMRRMFTDAFEVINRNFGEVFSELFGGGVAELTLTDPENVLTSGIEISAAPPGKTVKSLSLLSGGEQAFIAIALMFALIKYSPSPFCIFDEIEAALDEVNVSRVAAYIRKFSAEMQIIMITHRRGTMDIANTLYGVTMPRRGISKVFTLDVDAADGNDSFLS